MKRSSEVVAWCESGSGVEPSRIQFLNDIEVNEQGRFVLYWMQQSQRTDYNHALILAIELANLLEIPVAVHFGLMDDYPDASARHYSFMLDGLRDVANEFARRTIEFSVKAGHPATTTIEQSKRSALVVCDRGYLRHQKEWREEVARRSDRMVIQVESDVVLPVEVTSGKEEYAARTIRPKILKQRDEFLRKVRLPHCQVQASEALLEGGIDVSQLDLATFSSIEPYPPPVADIRGGQEAARRALTSFINGPLDGYSEHRNDPSLSSTSCISPYLHFGQISPVQIALGVQSAPNASDEDRRAYLDELIVQRELGMNFVHFNSDYDSYRALPDWAIRTLQEHRHDRREFLYSPDELEAGRTHDPYWNAAMKEMRVTGFMQGYMRMYWGKKVLEWSAQPEDAYDILLYLNNTYFVDGRDPLSYSNVAWIFGKHDRPWQKRPIFGTIRYMNANGLKRKFDIDAYVASVDKLNEEGWPQNI